jgi:predicted AAA+ superfamily ATPase
MDDRNIFPRLIEPRLAEAMADSPVVLIHGPRQSGKTTLAQRAGKKHSHAYLKSASTTSAIRTNTRWTSYWRAVASALPEWR